MTALDAPANSMLAELIWVHGMVRQDLRTCLELAEAVAAGAPAEEVRTGIRALQTGGPLFQLRVNCLRYCQFVHHHHTAESVLLFPAVRQAAPELGAAVDRLEADHRRVADLLDAVESAAAALGGPGDPDTRQQLIGALTELAAQLLEHLDFEETALAPVLRAWTR